VNVAVIGTGLLGASIGLAAGRWLEGRVLGFDADPGALAAAAARGAVEPTDSLDEAAAEANLVFVCTPVSGLATAILGALRSSRAVVTDVGSVKGSVVGEVRQALEGDPEHLRRFVGGHPLTGSERSGPHAASAALLDGATWALTPTEETAPEATDLVEDAVRGMGGTPVRLDPVRHDRMVALVSHLPQLASTALMRTATAGDGDEPQPLMLAAGGFRDLTRLAASSPELWVDILLANRKEVAAAVEALIDDLRGVAALVRDGAAAQLASVFEEAKRARLALAAKPQARVGVAILAVPIPDRPGALAGITGALAEGAVNIEDLEIVHAAEGARGTVHVTVGEGDAEAATRELGERDYVVTRLA
jgi:prephenate dehydrogenase